MKLATKSFADVEIAVAATIPANKVQIKERRVVCKACAHDFTVSEVIIHNTHPERGYCHCPNCQQINDIKKEPTFAYLADIEKKREVEELNNMLTSIVPKKELI